MNLISYAERRKKTAPVSIRGEDFIFELLQSGKIEYGNKFHCRTESHILQLAYAYNKILSLSNSRTRILAHQVESTHRIVNAINHRFLIADEVGLGKTIEAGLVIKELIYRHDYRRVLIACPASLVYQWQNEMKSKFNENFEILDRRLLCRAEKLAKGRNPWNVYDKVICSLDFLKSESCAKGLSSATWDIAVFDEAHRLRRDSLQTTLVYKMGELVAKRSKALLLLSATPFRGKLEELYFLIALLDKNILGPFQSFSQEYCMDGVDLSPLKKKLSEVLIRRTKKEIGGFTKRYATTIKFDMYPDERFLYDETTKYVIEEFNRAVQSNNKAVGFVMTVFQKLLDSSSFALLAALRNRKKRLEELLERGFSDEFSEEFTAKTAAELKLEIGTITRLIGIAENISINKKGEKLIKLLDSLKKKGCKKFLIFTQFRTTQDYLAGILKKYKTVVFNGSMNGAEKEQAVIEFKNGAEALIATEAGGEGRNMQFCNVVINYDLPWSPLKIEQRIGRIHRFGQPDDVFIYNFSTSGTVAERVLEVLTYKIKLFEDSIGASDVILGQIEDELKLNSLFMQIAAGKKNGKDLDEEIEERVLTARKNYEKLSELTVSGKMDFNYDEYYRITMKERRFSNRRIEAFINALHQEDSYCSEFISPKNPDNNLYQVKTCGKYGTFDSQTALENENIDFLAFGHPVINNLMEYARSADFGGYVGAKAVKYGKPCAGLLCNYVVAFKSVRETRELFPVIAPHCGDFDVDELERLSVESEPLCCDRKIIDSVVESASPQLDGLIAQAKERLLSKVERRVFSMSCDLDFSIDPQLEKIKESYDRTIKELEDKLELHKSRMKWYGTDLRSVITRTSNKIAAAKSEKERCLAKYIGYLGIQYDISLISAGFIVGV